jgi:hypothetical protein
MLAGVSVSFSFLAFSAGEDEFVNFGRYLRTFRMSALFRSTVSGFFDLFDEIVKSLP